MDEHETMFDDDVFHAIWMTAQDLEDIEYRERSEMLFNETNDKGYDPF